MAARHGHEKRRLLKCAEIDTDIVSEELMPLRKGNALFWAVQEGHGPCVIALLRSVRVSITAEATAQLRHVPKLNEKEMFGIYSTVLIAC